MFAVVSMDLNKSDAICKQTMLLINLFVYKSLPFSYDLKVTEFEDEKNVQLHQINLNSSIIKINNLTSNTKYSVNVSNNLHVFSTFNRI